MTSFHGVENGWEELLDWYENRTEHVERVWFLETYFPDYHLLMEIARDLMEPRETDSWAEVGRSGKASVNGKWNNLSGVAERYGVSKAFITDNLYGFMGRPGDPLGNGGRIGRVAGWVGRLRRAARAFVVDTARKNPGITVNWITDSLNELLPEDRQYDSTSVARILREEEPELMKRAKETQLEITRERARRRNGMQPLTKEEEEDITAQLLWGDK